MVAMITVVLLEEATGWHLHCNVNDEMWPHHRVQYVAADNLNLWRRKRQARLHRRGAIVHTHTHVIVSLYNMMVCVQVHKRRASESREPVLC